eukprot:Gregarina_sp_Poly_1__1581@NODE_13_length_23366_cov_172_320786_g11_i0_p2_GENE_NODE_13_length_23366_cov_172_320786_g11_i0NODE_13_length_23366_cov_172_320786_g11_i0_p2_ORF_typecomplete_len1295_score182_11RPAP1_C/PF08620_10/9_1e13RPAP1_N/PF08621_10/0_81RPAP1_N/PF08621_10/5e02_NODE_13_length_23366_cov_172_320786_g11_i01567919563
MSLSSSYANSFQAGFDLLGNAVDDEEDYFLNREACMNRIQVGLTNRPAVRVVRKKKEEKKVSKFSEDVKLSEERDAREYRDLDRKRIGAFASVMGDVKELEVDVRQDFLKQNIHIQNKCIVDLSNRYKPTPVSAPLSTPDDDILTAVSAETGALDFDKFISSTTPDNILALRNQLLNELSTDTLAAFEKLRQQHQIKKVSEKQLDSSQTADSTSQISPMATAIPSTQEASIINFNVTPDELKKLEWTEEIGDFDNEGYKHFLGMIAELRFDFEGNLCSPYYNDRSRVTQLNDHQNIAGLRNHGLLPQLPGYSIPEVLILLSSTFRPQKLIGLRILNAIALTRCKRKSRIIHMSGETKDLEISLGGYGFGRRRFDDYLFQSCMIHEKVLVIALSTDSALAELATETLAALFAPSGSPLTLLDDMMNKYIHSEVVENLPFKSCLYSDWFASRRRLIRSDELVKLLTDSSIDMSATLEQIIVEGQDVEASTVQDLKEVPDGELQQRRTDPLLSCMLWGTAGDSVPGFLIHCARFAATASPTTTIAILRLFECLALHSETAAEFVRRALVSRNTDGEAHISILIDKLVMAQQCTDQGFALRDDWDESALSLLTMLRALCSTLNLHPASLVSNDIVDLPVAPLCWRFISKWLSALAAVCEDETKLPLDFDCLGIEEAFAWLPLLTQLTWDAGAPGAILAMSEAFQKWIPLVFQHYHKLKSSALLRLARVWVVLMQVTILDTSTANCGFASLISRSCKKASRCFAESLVKLCSCSDFKNANLQLHLSAALYWTVRQFANCIEVSHRTLTAPVDNFVTSKARLTYVSNEYFLEPYLGSALTGGSSTARCNEESPIINSVLSILLTHLESADHAKVFTSCEAAGLYSDWITSLTGEVSEDISFRHLMISSMARLTAVIIKYANDIRVLLDISGEAVIDSADCVKESLTGYLGRCLMSKDSHELMTFSSFDGAWYHLTTPIFDSMVYLLLVSSTHIPIGLFTLLASGCGTRATLEKLIEQCKEIDITEVKDFVIQSSMGGVTLVDEENNSIQHRCFLSTNFLDTLTSIEIPLKDIGLSETFAEGGKNLARDLGWISIISDLLPFLKERLADILIRTLTAMSDQWMIIEEEHQQIFDNFHRRMCQFIMEEAGSTNVLSTSDYCERRESDIMIWLNRIVKSKRKKENIFQFLVPTLLDSVIHQGVWPTQKLAWLWILRLTSFGDYYRKATDCVWTDSTFLNLCVRHLTVTDVISQGAVCGIPLSQFLQIPSHHKFRDCLIFYETLIRNERPLFNVPERVMEILKH